MHRTALFILFALAGTASAKPITLRYDRAFDNAWLVAEVEVVKVEFAKWMAWGGQRGYVRIKVTTDPSRIYRGWKHLGRTYEIKPADFGAQTCTVTLKRHEGSLNRILLVVDAQRVITLGGETEGDGYLLRGWCDNNDCRLKAAKGFGGEVIKRQRDDRLSIARATLLDRYRTPRREFWARVTRFLDGAQPFTPAEFSSPDTVQRVAARLRDIHALDPVIGTFDPYGDIRRWLATTDERGVVRPDRMHAVVALVDQTQRRRSQDRTALVLCHNDPYYLNVLDDGTLWFLDWEYAGMGDPLFDLAGVGYSLDDEGRDVLIDAYFGEVTDQYRHDLVDMIRLFLAWNVAWSLMHITSSSVDHDYRQFAEGLLDITPM